MKPQELGGGRHARIFLVDDVDLTSRTTNKQPEQKLIRKEYDMSVPYLKGAYVHEVKILKHLTKLNCPFTPHLIHHDDQKGHIWMTYCGGPVPATSKNVEEVEKLRRQLEKKFKVREKINLRKKIFAWFRGGLGKYCHNVTMSNKQLYFIDFGSNSWKIIE